MYAAPPDTGESSSTARRGIYRESSVPPNVILPSSCGRCGYLFEYPEGTPWSHISNMVDQHWRVCPNSISATVARSRQGAGEPGRRGEGSISRSWKKEGSLPSENESTGIPMTSRKKNTMDEESRKRKLEADEWTTDVAPKSVKCRACGRTVSLDKRSRYYPGLWVKHRGKCMEIKRLEALTRTEAGDESTMSSDTKERSVFEPDPDFLRAPLDTGTTPMAEAARQNQYQAQAFGDVRGAGQRYDAVSLSDMGRAVGRSVEPEESIHHRTNQVRSEMIDPQYRRHNSAMSFGGQQHFPHSIRRRVSSSSNGDGYYEDSAYWSHAPFATNDPEPAEGEQGRRLYRNATQWELSSNFRDSARFPWM